MTQTKNRFFPNGIKKGDPISKRGMVEALIKMSNAIDRLSVHNGHIDWSKDVPKIVIDRFSKAIAFAVILPALLFGQVVQNEVSIRNISQVNDINKLPERYYDKAIHWFQGESIKLDVQAKVGNVPLAIGGDVFPVWFVANEENLQEVYMAKTGYVVSASSGEVSVEVPYQEATLDTNKAYRSWVMLFRTEDTGGAEPDLVEVATILYSHTVVHPSPLGTVYDVVQPAQSFVINVSGLINEADPVYQNSAAGLLVYNADRVTLNFEMEGGIYQDIGQQEFAVVINKDVQTINRGQVVYLFGAQGDKATVKLASNTGDSTSSKTLGIAAEPIAVNGQGLVVTAGSIYNVDTSAYTEGDRLYLGQNGNLVNVEPVTPLHSVFMGVAEKINANAGVVFVKVQNGYELGELHDVQITNPQVNDAVVYAYDAGNFYWTNKQVRLVGNENFTAINNSGKLTAGGGIETDVEFISEYGLRITTLPPLGNKAISIYDTRYGQTPDTEYFRVDRSGGTEYLFTRTAADFGGNQIINADVVGYAEDADLANYYTKTESDALYTATESDPVWQAEKSGYVTTASAAQYLTSETDPQHAAWMQAPAIADGERLHVRDIYGGSDLAEGGDLNLATLDGWLTDPNDINISAGQQGGGGTVRGSVYIQSDKVVVLGGQVTTDTSDSLTISGGAGNSLQTQQRAGDLYLKAGRDTAGQHGTLNIGASVNPANVTATTFRVDANRVVIDGETRFTNTAVHLDGQSLYFNGDAQSGVYLNPESGSSDTSSKRIYFGHRAGGQGFTQSLRVRSDGTPAYNIYGSDRPVMVGGGFANVSDFTHSGNMFVNGNLDLRGTITLRDAQNNVTGYITANGFQAGVNSFTATAAGDISQDSTNTATLGGITAVDYLKVGAQLTGAGGYSRPILFEAGGVNPAPPFNNIPVSTNRLASYNDDLYFYDPSDPNRLLGWQTRIVTEGRLAEGVTQGGLKIGENSFELDADGNLAANWNLNGYVISNGVVEGYATTGEVAAIVATLATGTPLYIESDPIWTSASNLYYTSAQADAVFATGTPLYTLEGAFTNGADIKITTGNDLFFYEPASSWPQGEIVWQYQGGGVTKLTLQGQSKPYFWSNTAGGQTNQIFTDATGPNIVDDGGWSFYKPIILYEDTPNGKAVVTITATNGLQVGENSFKVELTGDISQDATNTATLGDVSASSFAGDGSLLTNLTESDPVWASASNLYYTMTQSDSLFATGAPLYEVDLTPYATGTPLYTEADPLWALAASNYYTTNEVNVLFEQNKVGLNPFIMAPNPSAPVYSQHIGFTNAVGGYASLLLRDDTLRIATFTTPLGAKIWTEETDGAGSTLDADTIDGISSESFALNSVFSAATNDFEQRIASLEGYTPQTIGALSSNEWAVSDSTTNYAERVAFNSFTSSYATADSTTNYVRYTDFALYTNASYQIIDEIVTNSVGLPQYLVADSTTNYASRLAFEEFTNNYASAFVFTGYVSSATFEAYTNSNDLSDWSERVATSNVMMNGNAIEDVSYVTNSSGRGIDMDNGFISGAFTFLQTPAMSGYLATNGSAAGLTSFPSSLQTVNSANTNFLRRTSANPTNAGYFGSWNQVAMTWRDATSMVLKVYGPSNKWYGIVLNELPIE